jgi:hypothetical protein
MYFLLTFLIILFYFLNMLNNKPPIIAPYAVLFGHLEVIGHVPVVQPTNFQYKKPPAAPTSIPAIRSLLFDKKFHIGFLYKQRYDLHILQRE